jgi:ribonuclease HI
MATRSKREPARTIGLETSRRVANSGEFEMAWARMHFKGQSVWVRVDGRGKPVLDGGGRAEMKYREDDARVYRPAPANLLPAETTELAREVEPAERPGPGAGDRVDVWTDGACSGNPGPMGIGVVVLADGQRRERGEYLGEGTNNIAELVAIERGLQLASELRPESGAAGGATPISRHPGYAIGVLSKGWKAKANQALVERVRRTLAGCPRARLVKVPGHAGVPENERCDALARAAIVRRGPV